MHYIVVHKPNAVPLHTIVFLTRKSPIMLVDRFTVAIKSVKMGAMPKVSERNGRSAQ
jgi:hypothetical protein